MIAAIENAIIARLKSASDGGVLGYKLKSVGSYGGEFTDDDRLNELIQLPAAYVVFLGDRPLGEIGYADRLGGTFAVIVAAQNMRNEAATRHGTTAGDVGTYQMIKDVRGLLKRQNFGLDIAGLELGQARPLFSGKLKTRRASVFAVEFATEYSDAEDIDVVASGLDDFKTFHVNWDVPPIGNVAPDNELPDDANSDANDTQSLNT